MPKITKESFDQSAHIDTIEIESSFNSMGLFVRFVITFYPNFNNTTYVETLEPAQFDDTEELILEIKAKANKASDYYAEEYKKYLAAKRQLQLF